MPNALAVLRMIVLVPALLMISACGGGGGEDDDDEVIVLGDTTAYDLDETSGSVAFNSEFDYLHGRIVGASRVAGHSGNALNFGAVSGSHVLFDICCDLDAQWPVIFDFPTNALTVAAWMMPTSMESSSTYPVVGGSYSGVQSIRMQVVDGRITFELFPENAQPPITIVTSVSSLTNDAWQHVAVTYDGTTAILYMNGVENARNNISMPIEDVINDYYLGGVPSGGSFPGVIDEFVLSTRAYSANEIQALAN